MILFGILAIIAFILVVFLVLVGSVAGAAFIFVFADVIVCIAIIVWIMSRLRKR